MKHIRLEYPDMSTHNIIANNLKYNQKERIYLLNYYDLTESKTKEATLVKNEENFFLISINNNIKSEDFLNENISLLPKIVKTKHKNEEIEKITVYKSNYALFLNENICKHYNIAKNNNKRIIKGIPCLEITNKDLSELISRTKSEINYIFTYETKTARNYNYYELNEKLYVTRNIYELIQNSKLEIEGKPKIVDNRNCYSITKEQLNNFERRLHLRGTKINLTKEATIIYHDMNNDKLYLPIKAECISSNYVIMNKKCQEITSLELNNISNPIIAKVYRNIKPKITKEIIVCPYEDKIYIAKDIFDEFNIIKDKNEKIKIIDTIYIKINTDDLEYIKKIAEKNNTILKLNIKKIAPKKIEQ